nr:hypothetical protein [Tanacetum cinerariifolium]
MKLELGLKIDHKTRDVTKDTIMVGQAPKGILVGPKMAFKPNQEYRPVPKKNTVNSSVLNSVDNDVEMCTNGRGTLNLDKNGDISSGFSFWNVKNSSTSTTPIKDKIRKFDNLIIDGKAILMDKAGNPLKKVEYLDDHDSEYEVASVDNDMTRSLAS